MEIKELQERMNEFVSAKGWYAPESAKPQTPKNIAISLMLEAGEILEHFQWSETLKNPDALAEELADVALYLLQLSYLTGIDLEQSVLNKLQKNYKRNWE